MHRNGSIAWNHPLIQYGLHGIQHESALAEDTARSSVLGEAEGMVDEEGGAILRIYAKRHREVVCERSDRRIQND